jgi:hypothetical protein
MSLVMLDSYRKTLLNDATFILTNFIHLEYFLVKEKFYEKQGYPIYQNGGSMSKTHMVPKIFF